MVKGSRQKTVQHQDFFPIENNTKKWTHNKTYKKWVRALRKTKKIKRQASKDLCAGKDSICKSNIGIQRKYMPQFTTRRAPFSQSPLRRFRSFIKKKYGIESKNTTRKAIDLKPSQAEISRVRVEGLIEDGVINKMEVPIVVSKNDYVIDGHHRWAAFRKAAPKKPINAVVIDAPVKDILGMAIEWGAPSDAF